MISGVGIYETGKYPCRVAGVLYHGYKTWKHMIERCYDPKYSALFPTYIDCTVEESFKNYQQFMLWAEQQIGFETGVLDKDLLIKGNKQYNKNSCTFIPKEINGFLISCKASRGKYPVGVSYNQGQYMVTLSIDGKNKNLGRYTSPEIAFQVYKQAKQDRAKFLAEKYKNVIDPRAYSALLCYDVFIDD